MKKRILCIFTTIVFIALYLAGCAPQGNPDYSDAGSWAYLELDEAGTLADVFFICPTVYSGTDKSFNMPIDDSEMQNYFVGATNMEKGIYSENCRFFAPYYRQAALNAYTLTESQTEKYLALAYSDIETAFDYYISHYNNGRPIILAGFSQGADMCIRLMKEYFNSSEMSDLLIACYAIGWRITEDDLAEYPHLKMASGATDTGVIVSFNSEAENISDSLIIPSGTKTLAINPLNWQTDSNKADKSLNLGACFTDYDGNVLTEIPNFTGAYLDPVRGSLKITDVSPADYPSGLYLFEDGIYHVYDYQFFYRNLQQNVQDRISAYFEAETY